MTNINGMIADVKYIVQNSDFIISDSLSSKSPPPEMVESSRILEEIFLQIENSKTPVMDVFSVICSVYKTEIGLQFRPLKEICRYHDDSNGNHDSAYHSRFHHAKVMLSALILSMEQKITDPEILIPLFTTASVHDLWYKNSVEIAKKNGTTAEKESIETAFSLDLINSMDFSFDFINEINSATIFPAPIQYSDNEKTRKIQELLSTADLMPSLGISPRMYFRETMRIENEINMTLNPKARYEFVTLPEAKKRISNQIKNTVFEYNYKNICQYAENVMYQNHTPEYSF